MGKPTTSKYERNFPHVVHMDNVKISEHVETPHLFNIIFSESELTCTKLRNPIISSKQHDCFLRGYMGDALFQYLWIIQFRIHVLGIPLTLIQFFGVRADPDGGKWLHHLNRYSQSNAFTRDPQQDQVIII